jgi:Ser/Thr protein kinase RdoA (MazF antagonist)
VRKSWTYETILGEAPVWGSWRDGLGLDANGTKILEQTESTLMPTVWHDRFGLIHADRRLANLLVDGENLSVIDFDDCGLSWFCFDFAAAVTFLSRTLPPVAESAWITGYRCAGPLSIEDEVAIDMFIMLRRIQVTAWIASHSETPTAQQMGVPYTQGTVTLAKAYLGKTG